MSIAIELLATLGRRAQAGISTAELQQQLAGLPLSAELRDAFLRRDAAALTRLLGGNTNVAMLLLPVEEEPAQSPSDPAPSEPTEPVENEQIRAA